MQWEHYGIDVICWIIALTLAAVLRYDFTISRIPWQPLGWLIIIAAVLQAVYGYAFKEYRGRYQWGSFDELRRLGLTALFTGATLWLIGLMAGTAWSLSRGLVLIAAPIAVVLMFGIRYLVRYGQESKARVRPGAAPVILYGAGFVGEGLARRLSTDPTANYTPVAFLEDDKRKAHLILAGVPVKGTLEDLQSVAEETGAKQLVVTIAGPQTDLLKRVNTLAAKAGLKVMIMPPVEQVLREGVDENRLRDLKVEDLLGRPAVETNVSEIAGYLNGKRVLVTGAGGSIGSQLCVEINRHGPAELMLLDRDETGLQETEISITGNGLLDSSEVILADIRDAETLQKIFEERRPEVVFHAAALKHLPMLEQYPDEAWQTNVLGTLNVLEAASAVRVETFVNVSTDKAADPTSVLGFSKRLAEKLTAAAGQETGQRYMSVRFGNVIGSRGSMFPTFYRLIEEGKPLTVTHPDATRYFMTIPEACQLVLQAGGIGSSGEVMILDMGEPVRILDIAEQMIALSGKQIDIVFTGLRDGEKLDEVLLSSTETERRPHHPLISHAHVNAVSREELDKDRWDVQVLERAVV